MAVDPRQILAGVLTVTMFVMLGDMIKRDHFDSVNAIKRGLTGAAKEDDGPWKEDGFTLKPCWQKPVLEETDEFQGYVTFSLANGPEYHVSQIADAVVVARYLRAKLVIPAIRGSKPGDKRNFEDVYDVEKFIASLDGVVKVIKPQPNEISARKFAAVKVPSRVTEEQIAENIRASFQSKGKHKPQPEVREVVDSIIDGLKRISSKSNGQFVAIDFWVDTLEKKGCHKNGDSASQICHGPEEIAHFLRKTGFQKDTTVYVTQTKWDHSLDALKESFPKTYTKDSIMPIEKKDKFLSPDSWEFEKVMDFYICSESDVFVPAISGLFSASVAGRRIASGRTWILVPAKVPASTSSSEEFISHYVSKQNHFAHSCFC